MASEFLSLPEDWREQVSHVYDVRRGDDRDLIALIESWRPLQHKNDGGMCCNGKRGCGGPGSYCCSQTTYMHRHNDGSTGPFNLPEYAR